ncbi:MAG TPA: BadF/BadG/BcrA/BcrD ATPase family protein [Candidatus Limnocylindrales bacterium]|jgi:N-acetylglucosamine kinase-like BadF-type ATPase|nr:BadF/BadG/BcrA/BcrD ATPase family protein [Candidatus Limnocylindrales bacterium]
MPRRPAGRCVLGVDGGQTKTVALVADARGRILGAGRSGSSDVHAFREPNVPLGNVVSAVVLAAAEARVPTARLHPAVFSLAGADWPEDVELYRTELRDRLELGELPLVVNDAIGALRSGTDDGQGVSVVIGTGMAIGARGPGGPAGTSWHLGFWGEASGAVELGEQAMLAIVRAQLGIGPATSMTASALKRLGVASVEELLHAITGRDGMGDQGLARLAPVLLDAGHEGDAVAGGIVRRHGQVIADYAIAAARQVGWDSGYPVVLCGGVLRHRCTDLVDGIARGLPTATMVRATIEPVFGALLLAYDAAGIAVDRQRLGKTSPPPQFFETA